MLGFVRFFEEERPTMRHAAAAVVILAATAASAQYKTPQAPTQPPTVQSSNPVVQITPATPLPAPDKALESARRIERDEAIKMVKQKKAVWVDVREADQFAQGHIPGAINIPLSKLPNRWRDLPPKKFLITYCA
jgi:3-mercaptopyruvate sulfurtransferase SseA